jgi:hypothetical protein
MNSPPGARGRDRPRCRRRGRQRGADHLKPRPDLQRRTASFIAPEPRREDTCRARSTRDATWSCGPSPEVTLRSASAYTARAPPSAQHVSYGSSRRSDGGRAADAPHQGRVIGGQPDDTPCRAMASRVSSALKAPRRSPAREARPPEPGDHPLFASRKAASPYNAKISATGMPAATRSPCRRPGTEVRAAARAGGPQLS